MARGMLSSFLLLTSVALVRVSARPSVCAGDEIALSSGFLCLETGAARLLDGTSIEAPSRSTGTASGPWVVGILTTQPIGAAADALTTALSPFGCSLISFLPPSAFLIHVPGGPLGACVSTILALPWVAGRPQPLAPALRSPPELAHAIQVAAPVSVRVLSIVLAPGEAHVQAVRDLMTSLCGPPCELLHSPSDAGHAVVSALAYGDCATRCDIDAPIICGCVVPQSLLQAISAHPSVLWMERRGRARANNAFARASTETSDLLNSPIVRAESGACGDGTDCAQKAQLPFAELLATYGLGSRSGETKTRWGQASLSARAAVASQHPDAIASPRFVLNDTRAALESIPAYRRMRALRAAAQEPIATSTASCTAACSAPACGQGYATCSGLESPLSLAGLDGTGQLVSICDSGMDVALPHFFDPSMTVAAQKTLPLSLTAHRKVASYWAYSDRSDEPSGHGTHVAGTAAGDPAPVCTVAADVRVLSPLAGSAPGARIVFTDFVCDGETPCPVTSGVPWAGGMASCPVGDFCNPASFSQLFGASHAAGARVSGNSWGEQVGSSQYTSESSAIDAFIASSPDFLIVFAASNDYNFATIEIQAAAKNVLAVGATNDGLGAHIAKIAGDDSADGSPIFPPLYQLLDSRACGATIFSAIGNGYLPVTGCPAAPSNTQCAAMAVASPKLTPGFGVQLPYSKANLDIALCCGCTPANIIDGIASSYSAADAWSVLEYIFTPMNSRWKASFSSGGPTLDGRFKPDVTAPGLDIVSARSGGPSSPAYGTFVCPASGIVSTLAGLVSTPITGDGYLLFSITITTTEPTFLESVTLPTFSTSAGVLSLEVSGPGEMLPQQVISVSSATSSTSFEWTLAYQLGAGWTGELKFRASSGMTLTLSAATDPVEVPFCFGSISNKFGLQFSVARGSDVAYVTTKFGTSMSTPHVTGLGVLVRQFFTDGFFPTGRAVAASGFSPSAALMKAVIINSASPLLNTAWAETFGNTPPTLAKVMAEGGFGVPSLARGLPFANLGSASRSTGALVSMILPGLTLSSPKPGTQQPPPTSTPSIGVDPTLTDKSIAIFCVDVSANPGAAGVLPLSMTLVWTDPAGSPLAFYPLVNDLTLEVTPPGSTVTYFGNNVVNASFVQTRDGRNNVEKLEFAAPLSTLTFGTGARVTAPYSVLVRGSAVPFGPQAYSLVITGPGVALATPGSCGGDPFAPPTPPSATASVAGLTAATAVMSTLVGLLLIACLALAVFPSLRARFAAALTPKRIVGGAPGWEANKSAPLLPTQTASPLWTSASGAANAGAVGAAPK